MFRIFSKLRWFFVTQKVSYGIAIALVIANYGLIMIPPYLTGYLADRIMQESIGLGELYRMLLLLVLSIAVSYAFNYGWSFLLFRGAERITYQTRAKLIRKFLVQSPIFFEKNSTGSLMGKSTNDVRALEDMAGFGIMALFDAMVYPVALFFVMGMTTSWTLTLLSILPLPVLIFFSKQIGKKLYVEFDKAQEAFDHMNDSVLENVSGVRILRAFNREENEKKRFHETAEDLYTKNMRVSILNALYSPAVRIIPGFSYVIALGVGAYLIGNNQLTIGQLISFTVYLSMMVWPMFALGEYINVSEQANASVDRIDEVLAYPEEIVEPEAPLAYTGGGAIEFRDFSFSYPSAMEPSLSEVSFTLPAGQTLGITGKIGSGKTTLVKQLLHLYPVEKNGIFYGGQPIEAYDRKSLRAQIGYVPQQHILFSKTVRENIAFGSTDCTEDDVNRAVALADFQKDLAQLPNGLDTLAGEKGIALSGGQKQRISIARAMIADPEILIFDDSLSAVDANTETKIIENIRKHRAGKTTIIVAHRLSAIAHADLILVMDLGRIVERGTHESLLAQTGWYREQFEYQKIKGGHDERTA